MLDVGKRNSFFDSFVFNDEIIFVFPNLVGETEHQLFHYQEAERTHHKWHYQKRLVRLFIFWTNKSDNEEHS